jgi:hypothetical protein
MKPQKQGYYWAKYDTTCEWEVVFVKGNIGDFIVYRCGFVGWSQIESFLDFGKMIKKPSGYFK